MTNADWNVYETQNGVRVAVHGRVPYERALTPADAVAVFLGIYPEYSPLDLSASQD